MPTYSRPKAPRPSGRTPTPVPKLMPSPVRGTQPQQAQGRNVVNQGGQQGVVGRGGNFQALGDAALSKLPAPAPAPTAAPLMKSYPAPMLPSGGGGLDQWFRDNPSARGTPWSGRPDTTALPGSGGGGDIESAISSLRGQLGMPPGSDAALAAGAGANGQGQGPAPGIAARLAGRMPMPPLPPGQLPGQQPQANDLMAKFGAGRPNPYAEILRQRMNPAAGAAAGAALSGMGGYAY